MNNIVLLLAVAALLLAVSSVRWPWGMTASVILLCVVVLLDLLGVHGAR